MNGDYLGTHLDGNSGRYRRDETFARYDKLIDYDSSVIFPVNHPYA